MVVEDDTDIQELIKYNLEKEGYAVLCEEDGARALNKIKNKKPDIILLDLMLPGMDGLAVCRELRADSSTRHIPVIMLTAKSEEVDIVTGLEVGADDYMTKPFSPRVLIARVHACLRRKETSTDVVIISKIKCGHLEIDAEKHQVSVKGKQVELTFSEFKILQALVSRPGIVFSRYQIVDAVRGSDYAVTDRAVDVQIVGLRKKLGVCSDYIETIRGVGYKFREGIK